MLFKDKTMVTEQYRMEDNAKITPKVEHIKSMTSISGTDEAVDAKNSNHNNNSNEKVWLYEENIKKLYSLDENPERHKFLDEFFHYRRTNGLYCKIPVIARKPLDVFHLYSIVQRYGGFEQTMKNRMWSQIARELELPRTMTSGAFTLKLKYIRLLYQFECFKTKKQVNKSILFNEAILNETSKDRYDIEETRRHRFNPMMHSHLDDENDVEYFRNTKEKEYRNALMSQRSKTEDQIYYQHDRNQSEYHNPHSLDTVISPVGKLSTPLSPSKMRRVPSEEDCHIPNSTSKRRHENGDLEEFERNEKRLKPSSFDMLSRFTVDMIETAATHITLRVRLNDEIYEGILKCSEASNYSRNWGFYMPEKS